MKKFIGLTCAITAAAMLLSACGTSSKTSSVSSTASSSQAASSSEVQSTSVAESAPETEAAGKFTETSLQIPAENYDIPAVLTIPELAEGEKAPCVVMLHGTGSDKDEAGGGYKKLAPVLAESGIASIRIDFAGSGESKADYSLYNFTSAKADANAAADYVKTLDQIDGDKIGIMGWSQGGTMALLAASENENFKSVVTWAGALDLSKLVTEEMIEQAKADGQTKLEFEWREPLNLGLQWIEEMQSTDVLAAVGKIKAPVLAINGGKDDVVLPENAEKIASAATNEKSTSSIIENADHTFNIFTEDMTDFDMLAAQTTQWFVDTLK